MNFWKRIAIRDLEWLNSRHTTEHIWRHMPVCPRKHVQSWSHVLWVKTRMAIAELFALYVITNILTMVAKHGK